uniref:O-antigen polymerase n=2 Tax=Plesiomonas shigelloides TaxID=703 RepID=A0A4D6U7J8_PLESH|nr:O-antigen polymerase [Plesiomonas shigelloides]
MTSARLKLVERDNFAITLLVILSFCIDLSSPIITYGVQFVLVFVLAFYTIFARESPSIPRGNFVLFFILIITVTVFTLYQHTYLEHQELLFLQYFRVLLWMACGFLFYAYLLSQQSATIARALMVTILITGGALYIQYLVYYAFGYVIDYSLLLGGSASRIFFLTFRPSGFTAEPAVYSGIMIGLLSVYYMFVRRLNMIVIFGLISVVLTSSIAGLMMSVLYVLVVFFSRPSLGRIVISIAALFIIIGLFFPVIQERYVTTVSGSDASNNTKFETVINMYEHSNLLLSGYGFVGKSDSAPSFYEGLYDMTFFGATIITFGLPLGLCICFFVVYIILTQPADGKILILVSLIKLSSPMCMFFNLFVALVFVVRYKARLNILSV